MHWFKVVKKAEPIFGSALNLVARDSIGEDVFTFSFIGA